MPKQIIFLMSDTTLPVMLGCYGNEDMHTPHIDALAHGGMRFDHAYTTQPVCGPARSGIFTGLFPHSNGMWSNSMALGDNVPTIGQRLSEQGISTAYIGKWHLDGGDYFGLGKAPEGWDPDYWYDMRNYLEELEDPEKRYWSRQAESSDNGGVQDSETYAYRCAERAIDFIEKHKDEDFFLVVSFDEPHDPALCPEPFASMYNDYVLPESPNVADTLSNKPRHQQVWAGPRLEQDREGMQVKAPRLLASNSHMDQQIGRIMEATKDHLNTEELLTIYTSDHGDALETHRLFAKGPCMYREIAQVPLIYNSPS